MKSDKMIVKKRIAFFIGGLNFGGMERVVFIAKELLEKEYDIKIVTLYQESNDYKIEPDYYNLGVPPSKQKLKTFVKRFFKTIKMKNELKPDIVFSFGMYSNYLNILSNFFINRKIETIIGIRSYDWLTIPFVTTAFDAWIVKMANKVNCVSKLIARDAEKIWGIPTDKNYVLYNPYDVNYLQKLADEEIDDFDFDESKYYFITMGRLADQKGYNHLIRAFERVRKIHKDTMLIILGNGDRKVAIENMIKDYGLEKSILLLGGKSNPHKYVKRSNVYVLSSVTEGFPNALAETMCIGTPIVATNCKSGPSEILCNGKILESINNNFFVADYGIISKELFMDREYVKKDICLEEMALAQAMCFAYENKAVTELLANKAQKHIRYFDYQKFKNNLKCIIDA